MQTKRHKTLILACGALAKEIVTLKDMLGFEEGVFDLQCLPANYHNFPDKIVPALEQILDERGNRYDRILIGYGDCGTGGGLDRMLANYPKLIYMSQTPTDVLLNDAQAAADYLGLDFEHRSTGYGLLKEHIARLKTHEAADV